MTKERAKEIEINVLDKHIDSIKMALLDSDDTNVAFDIGHIMGMIRQDLKMELSEDCTKDKAREVANKINVKSAQTKVIDDLVYRIKHEAGTMPMGYSEYYHSESQIDATASEVKSRL